MKKVALFATVLALALAASAQESNSVGANVILPNARHVSASAEGMTTAQPANQQSASADAKVQMSGGPPGPPVQKQGPTAVIGPTAGKTVGPAAK
jgi:hypothetical protein